MASFYRIGLAGLLTGLVGCGGASESGATDTKTSSPDTILDAPSDGATEIAVGGECAAETLGCGALVSGTLGGAGAWNTYPCDPERREWPGGERRFRVDSGGAAGSVAVTGDVGLFGLDGTCSQVGCTAGGSTGLAFGGDGATEVVVDGAAGAPFSLTVTCCLPSCAGKACGPDGCGGTCGPCTAGTVCDAAAGACVAASCLAAQTIACGETIDAIALGGAGSTAAVPAVGCDGRELGGREQALAVVATEDGVLIAETKGGLASSIAILDGADGACDPSKCLAVGSTRASASVEAGRAYVVLLDQPVEGDDTVELTVACCTPACAGRECGDDGCGGSCGTCGEAIFCGLDGQCAELGCVAGAELSCGDSLDDVASDGPGSSTGMFTSSCVTQDYSGPERVYGFTSPFTGTVHFRMPPKDADEDLDLFVYGGVGGGCDASNCLSWGFSGASVDVTTGQRYYVVVDGYLGNVATFDLAVDCCTADCTGKVCGSDGCGGSCGGCASGEACAVDGSACAAVGASTNDTCASATVVTALPFEASVDTTGLADDYSMDGKPGCAAQEKGGPDAVFAYTSPANQDVLLTIVLNPDPLGECLLIAPGASCSPTIAYATTGCPDTASTCLVGHDFYVDPTKTLQLSVVANETVYVVLDGFDGVEAGIAVVRLEVD